MPALNTANFTSWANGLNDTDWTAFSNDLSTNWMNAWSTRFTLTTRWQTALGGICADDRNALIQATAKMASAIAGGLSTAATGMYLDISPGGAHVNNIQAGVRLEYFYANISGTITVVSATISTWTIFLNER